MINIQINGKKKFNILASGDRIQAIILMPKLTSIAITVILIMFDKSLLPKIAEAMRYAKTKASAPKMTPINLPISAKKGIIKESVVNSKFNTKLNIK